MTVARHAVIGKPVAHSLSPRIHALFSQQLDVALSYEAIEVAPADLAAQLGRMHADGWGGLNVTLPHKVAVAALCERVSERAQLAGAANCLSRSQAGWIADNTDGEGLIRDLARLKIDIAQRRVLVLGAGGAARGIIAPLLAAAPRELVLSSRNPWKPEELAERFKPQGRVRPCTHLALKGDRFDVIVNATSAGHAGEMPRLPGSLLAPGGACYDLSYGAAHAPFAAWAQSQRASHIADGLGMLVEQAAVSFEIWFGKSPEVEPVLAALRGAAAATGS